MEEFTMQAKDGLPLSVALSEVAEPRAVVQIIHGMKEHKERYYEFMQVLNQSGFTAIVTTGVMANHSTNSFP